MSHIFWKMENCGCENWQNYIEKIKLGRIRELK